MCHGAGIFSKLRRAQHGGILHSLDGTRAHIRREFSIAKHGKTFFQAELKPVATGYPVTTPVVKIFMGNNSLYALESLVCRGLWTAQYARGIENIKAFVFHRPHIKVVHRHDIENIQIVFATINLFVPVHGLLKGQHGVTTLVDVFLFDIDAQAYLATRTGCEAVLDMSQVPRDQCK